MPHTGSSLQPLQLESDSQKPELVSTVLWLAAFLSVSLQLKGGDWNWKAMVSRCDVCTCMSLQLQRTLLASSRVQPPADTLREQPAHASSPLQLPLSSCRHTEKWKAIQRTLFASFSFQRLLSCRRGMGERLELVSGGNWVSAFSVPLQLESSSWKPELVRSVLLVALQPEGGG